MEGGPIIGLSQRRHGSTASCLGGPAKYAKGYTFDLPLATKFGWYRINQGYLVCANNI